jgi:hypothetical protein
LLKKERDGWIKKYGMICEANGPEVCYVYKADMDGRKQEAERIFALEKNLEVTSNGFKEIKLSTKAGKPNGTRATSELPILSLAKNELYVGTLYKCIQSGFGYLVEAVFDRKTKEVKWDHLVLLDSKGVVVAKKETKYTGEEEFCDGCGTPTFDYGSRQFYATYGLLESPLFKYPILLLDTSTVEGRAVSMGTFNLDGKFDEIRRYEYVVHCGE